MRIGSKLHFLSAALFLLVCASTPALAEPVLYYGGEVFTARSDVPDAAWFVVDKGRFIDVGTGEGVPAKWSSLTQRFDLDGRFVLPGFVDAHLHFIDGGLSLLQTDLGDVRDAEGLAEALRLARQQPINGWTVARNLDLQPLGGRLPDHQSMGPLTGERPAYIALKSGHHVYLNRAGLESLGIDGETPDPEGGVILRDGDGYPTGVMVDTAAWNAQRKLYAKLPPQLIAQAILTAQQRALSYGITAIGDNTFYPDHAAQYERLSAAGRFVMRAALRSYGKVRDTRFLMRQTGVDFFGNRDSRLTYFGDKYFMDESLSVSTYDEGRKPDIVPGGRAEHTEDVVRDLLLFAGRYGTAFHVQGREGARRIVNARLAVQDRRKSAYPDVMDHCGSCGGDLPRQIREAGLTVTLLPGQLHELPQLTEAYGSEIMQNVLQFRQLFDAGVTPALTSDWPFGAPPSSEGGARDFHRLGLAPISGIAVSVFGKGPEGVTIPGAEERTITLAQALASYTTNGAAAIGRANELGRIATGYHADFVVLPASPFGQGPARLYDLEVDMTYVGGRKVYDRGVPTVGIGRFEPAAAAADFSSTPIGWTPSPIIGYDPVPGLILGAALFVYPYRADGLLGNVQLMVAPMQGARLLATTELAWLRVLPNVDLRLSSRFENWQGRYYGTGIGASAEDPLETDPMDVETTAGLSFHVGDHLQLYSGVVHGVLYDETAGEIAVVGGSTEGPIEGHRTGVRMQLGHDTREGMFSPRFGGLRTLWAEWWPVQGGQVLHRGKAGVELSQFVPLYKPDVVLAIRGLGGVSLGEPAYSTNYRLGGIMLLRGYLGNRFRGHHYAAATGELRFPIWSFVSGAAYGETGMVWLDDQDDPENELAYVGGAGLRFGLPPDFLIKLRFDVGFGRDQWGIFFNFNEAF